MDFWYFIKNKKGGVLMAVVVKKEDDSVEKDWRDGWHCYACDGDCDCAEILEEKQPCNVFIYLFKEKRLPKRFRDFKQLAVGVLTAYQDPTLSGSFSEEFIRDDTAKLIFIGSKPLLEDYFEEVKQAYIPDHPDYSSQRAMLKAGLEWQKGDLVFILVRRSPDIWWLKGGVYQPK
jgi:hypothetical protein